MERKAFKLPFYPDMGQTMYPCPTCGKGFLGIKKDSFQKEATNDSTKEAHKEYWDPEGIVYLYSCLFECRNPECKDVVSSSGSGGVLEYTYLDEQGDCEVSSSDYFLPRFFLPHLRLFSVPKNTPESVVKEVNKSFSLLFCDPASAANHIRVALEHLLTYMNVNRFSTKNGKRNYLALHKRIELLPRKYNHIKDLFFAVKWLGNAGSHSKHKVSLDDVLDSYEIMDELLVDIFTNPRRTVISLANKINKKKGPK